MANVKNYGLVGVGTTVQFGKAGPSLGQQTSTILKADGTAAFRLPAGNNATQPDAIDTGSGGMRYNSDVGSMEFSNGSVWVSVATGGTAVTSVTGTTNRITSTGGTTPVLDIAATYIGQTSITTLGSVSTGTWNASTIDVAHGGTGAATFTAGYLKASGTSAFTTTSTIPTSDLTGILSGANGGTGVDNTGKTITLGGNLTTSGAFATTLTVTGATSLTLPTSGTLLTTDDTSAYVKSISFGSTGLTPATASTGDVTVAGTLVAANGGTGLATFSSGSVLYASGLNTWSAAAPGATSGVQAYDAGLAALAAKTSTGIMVQTGNDTFTSVSLVAPAAGITITNDSGTGGNPTFALANDLAALEGLATTGYIVRTGDGTATTRAIVGTSGNIVVTNGSGVSSDTSIDLATLGTPVTASFVKVTTDTFGRVSATTPVVTSDITSLVDGTYVNVAGDTVTGNLTFTGGAKITGLPDPTNALDAANKQYVDATASGLQIHDACDLATTVAFVSTYSNGTLGVGATLTNADSPQAALVIDGVAATVADRVLVKNQADAKQNGIYVVTNIGSGSTNWILTRSSDDNNSVPGQVQAGDFTFISEGTQAATGWVQTNVGTGTSGHIIIGTDNIVWSQFSGAGTYSAGTGLSLSGTTFNVNLGAGIAQLPSDEVGIDLYDAVAGGLILTEDGSTRSSGTNSKISLLLKAAGGLTQDTNGLYVPAAGITNAMLVNSAVTINSDGGTAPLALGGTLEVKGTSTQGISTTNSGSSITITAANASSSQKGVATFAATEFVVTAGNVALGLVSAPKGGTGQSAYTIGDILYASSTDALSKLAVGGAGTVLKGGGATPVYGAVSLTTDVSGILPAANGGTGVANTNTITIGGNISAAGVITTAGDFITSGANSLTLTTTGATNVTLPTTGTLATVANTVSTFSGGTTGLTPSTTSGAVTLGGTLVVANGGTGVATLGANQVMLGNGTGAVLTSSGLSFTGSTLTVGAATIAGGTDITVTSTGDVVFAVPAGTTAKVSVSGPTATQYATGLADGDLVNKLYVDTVAGSATGDIKAYKATVSLALDGETNIGSALPAGATILSVKVKVNVVDTAATLSVGKSGSVSAYMAASENDAQVTGLYLAECFVTEGSATQVIATVAASENAIGATCDVIVTYQIA